jgi:uncharacterized protein YbaP (TraB family)
MKRRHLYSCLSLLLLLFANPAQAADPVWKIVKGDSVLFLGGTVHVLTKADYPLPPAFEKAYSQAKTVVFESDTRKMQTPEFQNELLSKVIYQDGRSLKTVLNEKTYRELERHSIERGLPMENLVKFKPGMLAITLTVIEMQRLGLLGSGVDEFFLLRTINDQKEVGQLETADEQLNFLAALGEGQENEAISSSLRDIQTLPALMQATKDAWRRGDNQKLYEVSLAPIQNQFPGAYQALMVKRNNAWIPKIEAMLATNDVELVLVGALHLVGDDGLLALLAARGYEIQQQ